MCLPFCHNWELVTRDSKDVYIIDFDGNRPKLPQYTKIALLLKCTKCGDHKIKKYKV